MCFHFKNRYGFKFMFSLCFKINEKSIVVILQRKMDSYDMSSSFSIIDMSGASCHTYLEHIFCYRSNNLWVASWNVFLKWSAVLWERPVSNVLFPTLLLPSRIFWNSISLACKNYLVKFLIPFPWEKVLVLEWWKGLIPCQCLKDPHCTS